MRVSIIILLSILALCLAQEAVVEEAIDARSVENEEELDLDALLEEDPLIEDVVPDAATGEADATTTTASETAEEQEAESQQQESASDASNASEQQEQQQQQEPEQMGPFIDLLGPHLYSLEFIDESQARINPHYTNDALQGKKVVGLYFSADWCGPCKKFTPELVSFYDKMNSRRGHKDDFEIVWVSRCRDMNSFGQYFTHMKWLAMPFEEAAGQRGQWLSEKYKVKGIPTLVLLDDLGNIITTDARNKIPQDKAGIGFPWQNPFVSLMNTVVPRSLRLMVKTQLDSIKGVLVQRVKGLVGMSKARKAA